VKGLVHLTWQAGFALSGDHYVPARVNSDKGAVADLFAPSRPWNEIRVRKLPLTFCDVVALVIHRRVALRSALPHKRVFKMLSNVGAMWRAICGRTPTIGFDLLWCSLHAIFFFHNIRLATIFISSSVHSGIQFSTWLEYAHGGA